MSLQCLEQSDFVFCSNGSCTNNGHTCKQDSDCTKLPIFCKEQPTSTKCDLWNGAMAALQQGLNPSKPKDNQDKTLPTMDGNYNAQLTECQRIQADQVKTYGDNDIFDIQALQDNWSGGQIHADSLNCKKTIYGVFGPHGTTNGHPAPMSSSEYWNALQADCNASLGDNKFTDGTKLTDVLQSNFYLVSDPRGLGTTVKFNFSCVPQDASTYTQCKLPGFDQLKGDDTKGWVVNDSSCTQNPIVHIKGKNWTPTCTNNTNTCNGDKTDNDDKKDCCTNPDDTSTCCPKGTSKCTGDNRPQDRYSTQCCVNCTSWQTDATQYGQFSAFDAQDPAYKSIIQKACFGNSSDSSDNDTPTQSHGCCLKTTTLGDTQSGQNCENCKRFASKIDMSDPDQNQIIFHIKDHPSRKYVDDPQGNGLGIAITPTGGTGGTPSTFADVRECSDGSAAGICRGLTGCAGLTSNDDYCNVGANCDTDNACNHGFNYTGKDQTFSNPAINCPNLYTLSRNLNDDCPTSTNYWTNPTLKGNLGKIIIPEGAWVTAYYSKDQSGKWNQNGGLCGDDANFAVMMGCGKETTTDGTQVAAHASEFKIDNGTWTNVNTDSKILGGTSYSSKNVQGAVTDVKGQSCTSDNPCSAGKTFCTFSGLDKTGQELGGYTFGFMPGYYNSKYTTSTGPCGGQY